MLDATAAAALGAYRRYLSPYKGFCCAYRTVTGRRSCSGHALGVVRRIGALALLQALPRQFARCKAAYAAWLARKDHAARTRQQRRHRTDCCDCGSCPFDCTDLLLSSDCSGKSMPCECGDLPLPCDCSL